jgi:AcrR family transcriptional regulator
MAPQPLSSSRDRLLQAAKRLFAAHGYEQTATSTIARQAGTSESQLMRYFGGKIGLLEAVFDAAWLDLDEKTRHAVGRRTTSRETLLETLQTFVTTLARDSDLAMLLLFEGRRLRGGEPRVRLAKGYVGLAEMLRNAIRAGQAAREIDRSLDAAAVASALLAATEGLVRDRWLARGSGARPFAEREIQKTLNALLDGIVSARPPRRRRST